MYPLRNLGCLKHKFMILYSNDYSLSGSSDIAFEIDSRRGSYMSHEDLEYLQHYSILDQTMSPIREVTSSNQQSTRSGGTKCQVSTDEMSSIGSSRSSNK